MIFDLKTDLTFFFLCKTDLTFNTINKYIYIIIDEEKKKRRKMRKPKGKTCHEM